MKPDAIVAINVLTNELTLHDGSVVKVDDVHRYGLGSTVQQCDENRRRFAAGETVYITVGIRVNKQGASEAAHYAAREASHAISDLLRQVGWKPCGDAHGLASGVAVRVRDDIEDIRRNGFGDRIYQVRGALLTDEDKRRVLPRDHACHPDNVSEDEST